MGKGKSMAKYSKMAYEMERKDLQKRAKKTKVLASKKININVFGEELTVSLIINERNMNMVKNNNVELMMGLEMRVTNIKRPIYVRCFEEFLMAIDQDVYTATLSKTVNNSDYNVDQINIDRVIELGRLVQVEEIKLDASGFPEEAIISRKKQKKRMI